MKEEDFAQISQVTHFTPDEVKILRKRFSELSGSQIKDGVIDIHEFQSALGLASLGFAQRIFSAFDVNGNKDLDFTEFVQGLSALSPRADLREKAVFCFKVYDIDKNGSIDKDELREVLNFSLGQNSAVHLPEAQLNKIIDTTFKAMDDDGNGEISFAEFEEQAKKNPGILNCVQLNLDTLLRE